MFAAAFAAAVLMPANAQVIRTTVAQGEIEGEAHDGYTLFKAIPYAEAPVGPLRWKKPVAKTPWNGVYKAADWGTRPWQSGLGEMSEDCLYLGIQTPASSPSDRLPVFVNIHGGGFSTGSYRGTQDSFVKEGIVYVSIEYRLGSLGFMAHPELSKEAGGLSGNYGLYDQIMALQWIHDNIAAFGGDPEKVTIGGESAGGISVAILCASPLCKGLFRGAISESGSSHTPVFDQAHGGIGNNKTVKGAEGIGEELQKSVGAKKFKDFRKMDAKAITEKSPYAAYFPVTDGVAILGDEYTQYEKGNFNDVNLLIGYNNDEGSLFLQKGDLNSYRQTVISQFGDDADKVFAAYPASNDQEALWALQDLMRDTMFGWGTWAWAKLQEKYGKSDCYFYYFCQHAKGSRGATHVAEMPYVYSWMRGEIADVDRHIAQIMPRYWINFIKTGDPNEDGIPYWPSYKSDEPTVMNVLNGFFLTTDPNPDKMETLDGIMAKYR